MLGDKIKVLTLFLLVLSLSLSVRLPCSRTFSYIYIYIVITLSTCYVPIDLMYNLKIFSKIWDEAMFTLTQPFSSSFLHRWFVILSSTDGSYSWMSVIVFIVVTWVPTSFAPFSCLKEAIKRSFERKKKIN